jgi:hypothetical protein
MKVEKKKVFFGIRIGFEKNVIYKEWDGQSTEVPKKDTEGG